MLTSLILSIALIALISCTSDELDSRVDFEKFQNEDNADIVDEVYSSTLQLRERWSVHYEDQTPDGEFAITEILDVALGSDHHVYILDENQLEIGKFSDNGELNSRIGGEGEGPGEFTRPGSVTYVDGKLLVTEENGRVQLFQNQSDGNWEVDRSMHEDKNFMDACFNGEHFYLYAYKDDATLHRAKPQLETVDNSFGHPVEHGHPMAKSDANNDGFVACTSSSEYIVKANRYSPIIAVYNHDEELYHEYKLSNLDPIDLIFHEEHDAFPGPAMEWAIPDRGHHDEIRGLSINDDSNVLIRAERHIAGEDDTEIQPFTMTIDLSTGELIRYELENHIYVVKDDIWITGSNHPAPNLSFQEESK